MLSIWKPIKTEGWYITPGSVRSDRKYPRETGQRGGALRPAEADVLGIALHGLWVWAARCPWQVPSHCSAMPELGTRPSTWADFITTWFFTLQCH